ncbi:hypothetical protein A6U86_08295 [Rhizobium sp. AC27/96]|uniref:DUF982 domain-containing protein n=1 Tax=Rhizobium sp. AC27/96 TaxID=1841653 RepID=UPI0008281B2B|nr:DUF982 domain-containing protein [Rhizobium sp. AC27/96]OCJ07075.1 hypothetical protein A6U86_08295 [Rhizobium sp. AC27/96]
MRQNSNNLEAGFAIGEKLADPETPVTSNASIPSDNSSLTSPEMASASGVMAANDAGVGEQGQIAHDMSILAEMVTRRRAARRNGLTTEDRRDFGSANASSAKSPTFPPVRIAVRGKDAVEVIDSIEKAVEYLTTLWPVRHGDAFEGALQSCIDGIKGRVSTQQVRAAFVNAAAAAGILILP